MTIHTIADESLTIDRDALAMISSALLLDGECRSMPTH